MRVLVACEFSGNVRDAFIAQGHDAMSCDLLPTDKPGPHYQGDVLDIIGNDWDLMIAHPPCRYLSKAGARWLYRTKGVLDPGRYRQGMDARRLFMQLLDAPIPRICVENPTPLRVFNLPQPQQVVQPFEYGHEYSKRTCLWLRGLPPLIGTVKVVNHSPWLPSNTGGSARGERSTAGTARSYKERARTFTGFASAMANQWGGKA